MPDLYQRSIEIILANQHASGAYVACPNFPTYRYCWFRDGSFVAYAMDLAGEHESAACFHAWAARAVNRRADVIRRNPGQVLAAQPAGAQLDESKETLSDSTGVLRTPNGVLRDADVLHTRLTLEGEDGTEEEWTNFQLDGFGTWLWALEQHRRLSGQPLPTDWLAAAGLAAEYLAALWQHPCYDCWEEFGDKVHPHTLAAIYGGLKAYEALTAEDAENAEGFKKNSAPSAYSAVNIALSAIRDYIEAHFVFDGHFVKFEGEPAVDASLLGLAVPYGVVAPDDPRMQATAAEIERSLRPSGENGGMHPLGEVHPKGGVHRYAADTYYGGGEWILLTAWLGWYYAELNAPDAKAKTGEILAWIESQAGADGSLPEQAPAHLNDPAYYPHWVEKWGPIATPLLWSHAEYIILKKVGK